MPLLGAGLAAGLLGGLAEVAWIALYQQLGGTAAATVARGVTGAVFPSLAAAPASAALGIAIHMVISVALGLAIVLAIHRLAPRIVGTLWEPLAVVATLLAVWVINFFVVLPVVSPAFVTIVPYGVSLVSKTLFGAAAAVVLIHASRNSAST
jgi:hypothetical protein